MSLLANRLMASRTGANGGDIGGRQQFSDSVTDHLIRPRDRWKTGPLRERPLRLFDFRVLPFVQRGYADNDNSGVRYNIYTLDYCTCVDLLGTKRGPGVRPGCCVRRWPS